MAVKVTGIKEATAAIEAIKSKSGRRVATAILAGANVVIEDAAERCPVLSGTLKGSIGVGIPVATKTKAHVDVGTDVVYAPYVEMGTAKQGAQPYLRPALIENKAEIVSEVQLAMKYLIAAEAKG